MDLTESVKLEIRGIAAETSKAWQVKLDCGVWWLPKSQCRIVGVHIYIPRWLADEKGIDYLSIDVD